MTTIEIKKLPESTVEIRGEISVKAFERFRPQAIKNITEHAEIPGFRKGRVPEQIAIQKIGEEKILHEMAELALQDAYPTLLSEHKIDPIGKPAITITKIAKGNPLGFSIHVAVVPEITLPDYKDIARKVCAEKDEPAIVEEKEIDAAIENIRKQAAKAEARQTTDAVEDTRKTNSSPVFDDEFVKTLGDYKDVADFKEKLREHLKQEKETRAQSKKRMKIIDGILSGTKIEIPRVVLESELDTIIAQFKADIGQMGASFEDYLKHVGKTESGIRKEFEPDAQKRAKIEFVLHKIGAIENIAPSLEEIEEEVAHILEHYHNADPARTRAYVENVLTNEKVLRFLEGKT
jgi:FKBP-type peptidyl-prolyl cis-trans isomerase (trigger factor)